MREIGRVVVTSENGRLTEDSGHREDEQLQQRVLLLVGQTQEAHFGHVGRVRHSSPSAGKTTVKLRTSALSTLEQDNRLLRLTKNRQQIHQKQTHGSAKS